MAKKDPIHVEAIDEIWDAKRDELIKKSLIQGNAILNLQRKWSITELRVFSIMLVHVKPHCKGSTFWDAEFRTVFIPINRIVEIFSIGQQKKPHMERVAASVDKMTSTSIGIRVNKKRHISLPVFEIIDLDMGIGLTAKFSKYMRRYILDLQEKRWTKSPFSEVFQLSKAHAVFLIQWLRSQEPLPSGSVDEWNAETTIEDLRERFGADGKSYDRVDILQQRIIVPAIEEINARLMFNITYEPLRGEYRSSRITGFVFHVKRVQIVDVPYEEENDKDEKEPFKLDDIEPKTGMKYSELEALIEEHEKAMQADMDEAFAGDMLKTEASASNATYGEPKKKHEEQEDLEATYLDYVSLDQKNGGLWGVSARMAKKFITALGWQRCKLISDSMIPSLEAGKLKKPAAALVGAWKENKLYEQRGIPIVNVAEPKWNPQIEDEPIDENEFEVL